MGILGCCAVTWLRACASCGLSLIERYLKIARVEIHQRIAGMHELVILHVDLDDGAVDARADGVEVHLHEGVVSGFELARVQPIDESRRPLPAGAPGRRS